MEIREKLDFAEKSFKQRGIKWNDNDGKIETAIKNALNDFTFRTTKKNDDIDFKGVEGLYQKLNKDNALVIIFENYDKKNYGNDDAFDEWHNKTCEYVMSVLKTLYKDIHYGKAQKIVNMTFKYLYCLVDENKRSYFDYCHIPLDSVILDWIWSQNEIMKEPYKEILKKKNGLPERLQHGYFDSWSNLEYESNDRFLTSDNKHYSYMFYQKLIRELCEGKGITPLQLEFLVWPQYQWERAAKEFYKQTENMLSIDNDKGKKTGNDLFNNINKLLDDELDLVDWGSEFKDSQK